MTVGRLARISSFLCAAALGVVFLFAAATKGADTGAFAEQVESYGIVHGSLAAAIAWILVPFEAALGAALLFGFLRRPTALVAGATLAFFIAVTGWAWAHGRNADCGCFGSLSSRGPAQVIEEDILFLALAAAAFAGAPRSRVERGEAGPSRGSSQMTRALAVVACAAGAIIYVLTAPRLPLDDYLTALRPGRDVATLGLGLEASLSAVNPPGAGSSCLVALLDLKAESIGETVAALNALATGPGFPRMVAFAAASEEERGAFFWQFGPVFELKTVPRTALRPLYRRLPRTFLVEDGKVSRIWNDAVPTPRELAEVSGRERENVAQPRRVGALLDPAEN